MTISVDRLPTQKLVLSYGILFILQHSRQAHRLAICIFLFYFLLSIQAPIWSEKCGTTLACILKTMLPIFLWFHFFPEKSIMSFPSLIMKIIHTINLNEFIACRCSLFALYTNSFQLFSYLLF